MDYSTERKIIAEIAAAFPHAEARPCPGGIAFRLKFAGLYSQWDWDRRERKPITSYAEWCSLRRHIEAVLGIVTPKPGVVPVMGVGSGVKSRAR